MANSRLPVSKQTVLGRNVWIVASAASALALYPGSMAWPQTDPVPIEKSVPNPIDGGVEFVAQTRLAAKGKTKESFRTEAINNLQQTQMLYTYQRVEIKGIWIKEDTNDFIPNLFDRQIEPSHTGDRDSSTIVVVPPWLQSAWNHYADLRDLHSDAYGQFSEVAARTVAELKDAEVNEIVTHSWGTEIVYNAILEGKIKPPRRLIVAGMPDRDFNKWQVLSKYTGTEVVVYADPHDPAARTARLLGSEIEKTEGKFGVFPNPDAFEDQWKAVCNTRPCNPHLRQPSHPRFDYSFKGMTHSRLSYLQAMIHDGTILQDVLESRAQQDAIVNAEIDRLYNNVLNQELRRVLEERAHSNEGTSFLNDLDGLQDVTRESKIIASPQIEAERLAAAQAAKEARDIESRRVWSEIEKENRAKKYVQALAGEACSNSTRVRELAAQHEIIPTTDLFSAFVAGSYDTTDTSGPGSLNGCQRDLLDQFDSARRAGQRVSSEDFVRWANTYHEQHPGLGKRFARAVSEFVDSLNAMLEVTNSGSGGGSIGRERPDPTERDRCHSTYISELNQTIRSCEVY